VANPERAARGTVIEAHLDRKSGPVATLLVQAGTLRVGDIVTASATYGRVSVESQQASWISLLPCGGLSVLFYMTAHWELRAGLLASILKPRPDVNTLDGAVPLVSQYEGTAHIPHALLYRVQVRALVDSLGKEVSDASPSIAVQMGGLGAVPTAGDEFAVRH